MAPSNLSITHLPIVPHICVSESVQHWFIYGLSPIWRQAIIWTNAGLLSVRPLRTNFSEILIKIQSFSFTKVQPKILSAKWRPFCPGEMRTVDASSLSPKCPSPPPQSPEQPPIATRLWCAITIVVATIFQTTFSNAFSWLILMAFWFEFPRTRRVTHFPALQNARVAVVMTSLHVQANIGGTTRG